MKSKKPPTEKSKDVEAVSSLYWLLGVLTVGLLGFFLTFSNLVNFKKEDSSTVKTSPVGEPPDIEEEIAVTTTQGEVLSTDEPLRP